MLRRIFSYSGKYKKYLVFAALCITAESLFELLIPLIMADIVDIGVANSDKEYIFRQGGWMLVCAAAALLLGIGSAQFSAIAGQGLGANLREAEYARLQKFSFANVDHFQLSSLVTRMTSDVTNIRTVFQAVCARPAEARSCLWQLQPWHFPSMQSWRSYLWWLFRRWPSACG